MKTNDTPPPADDPEANTAALPRTPCSAWLATSILGLADPKPIPSEVSKCPECGGALSFQLDCWEEEWGGLALECENEEWQDGESDEPDNHRWWQSDWQPVIDRVKAWLSKVYPQND